MERSARSGQPLRLRVQLASLDNVVWNLAGSRSAETHDTNRVRVTSMGTHMSSHAGRALRANNMYVLEPITKPRPTRNGVAARRR